MFCYSTDMERLSCFLDRIAEHRQWWRQRVVREFMRYTSSNSFSSLFIAVCDDVSICQVFCTSWCSGVLYRLKKLQWLLVLLPVCVVVLAFTLVFTGSAL